MGSSRKKQTSLLSILLFVLAAVGLYAYQAGLLAPIGLAPPSSVVSVTPGAWVQAHFTAPDFEDVALHRGGLDAVLVADLDRAQQSIDLASFDLDLSSVAQALIRAHQRGVRVRVIVDDENLEDEIVLELCEALDQAGIPIVYDQRNAFMHNKFAVIDKQVLWTGSWNLTDNGAYRNNNNALRFELAELAENYTVEFEEMFVDGAFGPSSPADTPYPVLQLSDDSVIENYFSPEDDVAAAILAQLRQAESEIVFMAYSFTDDDMGRVLLQKAREGVVVRGVFESRGASSEYSEYSLLRQAGLDVRLDGNPAIMHHKVFVVDAQILITGSYNFSASAANSNDENVLIIQNTELARSYLDEFERIYQVGQEE
ncbi:MAG: phospholipase [Chloroflexia bacterium]|nr:phospholipase [Chloroflexia bacterium]